MKQKTWFYFVTLKKGGPRGVFKTDSPEFATRLTKDRNVEWKEATRAEYLKVKKSLPPMETIVRVKQLRRKKQ